MIVAIVVLFVVVLVLLIFWIEAHGRANKHLHDLTQHKIAFDSQVREVQKAKTMVSEVLNAKETLQNTIATLQESRVEDEKRIIAISEQLQGAHAELRATKDQMTVLHSHGGAAARFARHALERLSVFETDSPFESDAALDAEEASTGSSD